MIDAMGEKFWTDADSGLPDPVRDPQFYEGVPLRRLVAFLIDLAVILMIDLAVFAALALLGLVTFGFAWMLVGFAWFAIGFFYRVWTLGSGASATPGMRLTGIEIRNAAGRRLSMNEAAVHTGGLYFAMFFLPLQLISVLMMAFGPRGRGLHDLPLGSAAINRPI